MSTHSKKEYTRMTPEMRQALDEDGCANLFVWCEVCESAIYIGDLEDGQEILCSRHERRNAFAT